MAKFSDGDDVKFMLAIGPGLHTYEQDPQFDDPRWQQHQLLDFVDQVVEAEALGWDAVSCTEHHSPSMTSASPHLLLAAAAMRTSLIRLFTAVTVVPLYHPVRIAEEAAALDLLSDGRFEIGIGRGSGEVQAASAGVISADEAVVRWKEGFEVLDLALSGEEFTYDGTYYPVPVPMKTSVRPLQDPLPIWMAAVSTESVERAAERGWNVLRNRGTLDQHREALQRYLEVGRANGHDVSGSSFSLERFVSIGRTMEEAQRNFQLASRGLTRFLEIITAGGRIPLPRDPDGGEFSGAASIAAIGTPESIVEDLTEVLERTGARRLQIACFSHDEIRMFAEEVIPRLRKVRAPALS